MNAKVGVHALNNEADGTLKKHPKFMSLRTIDYYIASSSTEIGRLSVAIAVDLDCSQICDIYPSRLLRTSARTYFLPRAKVHWLESVK